MKRNMLLLGLWLTAAAAGAEERAYRCRIVSYADKWTRHGFSNYMWWRHPNGPLAPKISEADLYSLTHDLDVDGDGRTDDDYVASLPFSLTVPLSNPEWPMHMAYPQRRSGRFYGGVSWYVANSTPQESPFWVEMGYNPDHSRTWFDVRAEDHPLQGQANEKKTDSFHRHYWAILWKKEDFLNEGSKYRVTFDETSRLASICTRDYWLGYDDVRMIVQDGDALYISDNQAFDIPSNGYKPARGRVFLLYPARATWARYEPKDHLIHFDWKNAKFEKHEFKDVQAVGWYLAKDKLEGKQSHLKWYGFEADAVVHRPAKPSVNLDMAAIPSAKDVPAFAIGTTPLPYSVWKDAHRYGDAPFHTLEARYIYLKDGDMGSMRADDKPHSSKEPVTNITFWDALAICNTLSEMEGKTPCYYVDAGFKEVFRNMEFATRTLPPPVRDRNSQNPVFEQVPPPRIYVKWEADGHRLPTPAEWLAAKNTGSVWEWCWPYGDVFDSETQDAQLALGGTSRKAGSPFGDVPWNGAYNIGLRPVCREAGLPRPAAGTVPSNIPSWQIRKGERTGATAEARAVSGPVLEMNPLPGGTFQRAPDGKTITISPLEMAKHLTTFAKWREVQQWAEARGYTFSRTGQMGSMYFFDYPHAPDEPVVQITWHDAAVWCNALSEMEGRTPVYYEDEACTRIYRSAFMYRPLKLDGPELVGVPPHRYEKYGAMAQPWLFIRWDADGYRLPTVAEYEYALRAGTQTPYFWGSDESAKDRYVWHIGNAGGQTHPAGLKQPNGFGLYDMQGNVHQWLNSMDGRRISTRPYELDVRNPKADPYWAWQQSWEVYSPPASVLVAGSSWLSGGFNINGGYGVTVEPQNSINTGLCYADVGFRVVRCAAGTHPRNGLEPLAEWPVLVKIDPAKFNSLQGAAFRANLLRNGAYETAGVPALKGLKWKFKTGGPVRSSPVAVNRVVYVGSDDGHFYAIDAASGQEKWRVPVPGGVMSSACVADGTVYFGGNDGQLYAVDAATGRVNWTAKGQGRLTSSPAVAYGMVFMEGSWAFDARTGQQVWSTTKESLRGQSEDRLSSLLIDRDILIKDGSKQDIATARYLSGSGDSWAGQNNDAVYGGTLFTLNSGVGGAVNLPELTAVDIQSGRRLWSRAITSPGQTAAERKVVLCSPAAWNGRVYLGFDGGLLFCFDTVKGETLWQFQAGGPIRSSPAISTTDGIVYFGSHDGNLYALDALTGSEKWRFSAGDKITSSPCVAEGVVYAGCDDGSVYAIN